ncbi:hypothetical protein JKP88DRAFT_319802, partial [Tribonema minus]
MALIAKYDDDLLVATATEITKEAMKSLDGSHDYEHAVRVCRLAERLAREEQVMDVLAVKLAALLHDIGDFKYFQDGERRLQDALSTLQAHGLPSETADKVHAIIRGIGFTEELRAAQAGEKRETFPELACCQDADRLDAIGAVGIARCFTFGGARGRPLYDPDVPVSSEIDYDRYVAQHLGNTGATINHFHEKLLKLSGMMKTESGRALARSRHEFMVAYLKQFEEEVAG